MPSSSSNVGDGKSSKPTTNAKSEAMKAFLAARRNRGAPVSSKKSVPPVEKQKKRKGTTSTRTSPRKRTRKKATRSNKN